MEYEDRAQVLIVVKYRGLMILSLGIFSLLFSILPFYGILAILPALVCIRMVFKSWPMIKKFTAPKGTTLSGLICSLLSLLFSSTQIFAVGFNQ